MAGRFNDGQAGRGHIDQLLSNYPKPEHIRFDSLSVNICTKWQVGHILPRKYVKKMTGRLRTIQYQNLYLAEIGLEVRLKNP